MTTNKEEQQLEEQLHPVVEAAIKTFDESYIRLIVRKKLNIGLDGTDKVLDWFNTQYFAMNRYQFFLPEKLAKIREEIFDTEELRNIVFDMINKMRYLVGLSNYGFANWKNYISLTAEAVATDTTFDLSVNSEEDRYPHLLAPKPFFIASEVKKSNIETILKCNAHLVVIHAILSNYERTALYLHSTEKAMDMVPKKEDDK